MRTMVNGIRWMFAGRSSTAAALQTLITKVFVLAINMGTGIITARLLEPQGRGEQAAMALWPQFLAYAMTLGIPVALLYNLKRYPEEESELFSAAVVISGALGVLATVTGIVFMPEWLSQYPSEIIYYARWFMLTAPMALLSVTFIAALEAEGQFTTANQAAYLSPLTTLVILAVLALTKTLTPFTAVLAYLLPGIPIFFWMLSILWQRFKPRWHGLGTSSYKRLFNYGFRAYGTDLLGTLAGQVDQVLVVNLLSPADMGLYVVSLSLSRMLYVVHDATMRVLLPKAAARPIAEVVAITGRTVRVGIAVTFFAAIGALTIGPVLLQLLYGNEYMEAIPVFRILVAEVVISGATAVMSQAFMAAGRPGTITILQGIALGMSVPLMVLLIPTYRLEGAGWALLCSTTVRFICVMACFPLLLKVPPPSLILTKEDLAFLKKTLESIKG